ncbi:MAG: glycoside-pentoside-hexuronide (GPH):cation symporter [Bifidobacteriaceae bacterium]|jgi:lactose/raffinose/galactose permease|nr:glycoside-pentoside-hexuronide (GPH):cation symporter [Bifidobacteriaceae bacterium]
METQKENKSLLTTFISYSFGGFGHDVLYAVMSTYLMTFLATQLFDEANTHWVVVITTTIMVLRIIELFVDPLIGGTIDKTRSKIGKFKPWILIGGAVWSLALIFLFTDMFSLPVNNPLFYVVVFSAVYLIMDFAFSFKDAAYWGMVSAIAIDSGTRNKLGTAARIGSVSGQAVVMIAAVPIIKFFSGSSSLRVSSEAIGDKTGWFIFGLIGTILAFITCIIVAVGTKESKQAIRTQNDHIGIKQIFSTLAKNDQLMWIAGSYIFFCLAQLTTQILLLPYFTYVVGNADLYSGIGVINLVASFISVAIFPILTKFIGRKQLYIICIILMIVGMLLFLVSGSNVPIAYVGYLFFQFPYPILFLCVMLTIADTVEYGQWKNGTRAEAATLVVRVMCDKLGGAISNGVMGLVAIFCGIHAGATSETFAANPQNLINFKILMIGLPALFMLISAALYKTKVKIDEKMHEKIVKELEERAKS